LGLIGGVGDPAPAPSVVFIDRPASTLGPPPPYHLAETFLCCT
jgi:hypothetical protein